MQRRTFTKKNLYNATKKAFSDGISLPLNHQNPVRIDFICRFDHDMIQIRVQLAVYYRYGSRPGYGFKSIQIQRMIKIRICAKYTFITCKRTQSKRNNLFECTYVNEKRLYNMF